LSRLFCQDQDQDQDWVSRPRPRPRLYFLLFFVLEAPRDQDFGLEDYITEYWAQQLCN